MKIEATAKEIADLVSELQDRRNAFVPTCEEACGCTYEQTVGNPIKTTASCPDSQEDKT